MPRKSKKKGANGGAAPRNTTEKVEVKVAIDEKVAGKPAAVKRRQRQPRKRRGNGPRIEVHSKNLPKVSQRIAGMANRSGLARKVEARAASKVIEAITLPRNSQPLRLGSGAYGSDPTGACNPWREIPISFNDGAFPATKEFANVAFMFRSSLRAAVYSYNTKDFPCHYYAVDSSGSDNLAVDASFYYNPGALADQNGNGPHGPYLYSGRNGPSDEHRGFWIDAGTNVTVVVGPTVIDAVFEVKIMRYSGREWIEENVHAYAAGGGSFAYPALTSAYYAFVFKYVSSVSGTAGPANFSVDLAWTDIGQAFAHIPIPDMEKQFASVERLRIIGMGLMQTNNSAAIQKQGTCVGAQLDPGTQWTDYLEWKSLSKLRKANIRPSDNGIYGFCKPADPKDLAFLAEFQTATGGLNDEQALSELGELSDCAFLITPESPFIAVAMDVSQVLTGVTGYYTFSWSVEFLSNDLWRSLSLGEIDDDILKESLAFISAVPQWHANSDHITDLWNSIKSVAGKIVDGVMEYGPSVLKAAAFIAPLLL